MKHLIQNIFFAVGACVALCACSHEEIEAYSANDNGVYFNYNTSSELESSINFANHVLGNPRSLPLTLNLKAMGVKVDYERKVTLKSKALEGYPLLTVNCPEVVFEPDSIEKRVIVEVMRPEQRDSDYAAVLYIDGGDQVSTNIKGLQEFVIHGSESFVKPEGWNEWSMVQMYLGNWSVDKHIFLTNLTKNNQFYNSNDYYQIIKWNMAGVDSLRRWQQEHPGEAVAVDIPFINEGDFNYAEPWYWNDVLMRYLGQYKSANFAAICGALGVSTRNEYQTFHVDEAGAKLLNRTAVTSMMEKYNTFYHDGWRSGDSYKSNFFIPMFGDIDYEVVEPAAWTDADGGADMVKQYYGEYSAEKYKFMIKVWLQHKGEKFVLNQMFPVKNEWGSVSWDSSLGGENAIKECNKVFRKAMAGGTYNFTFPTID